MFVGRSRSLLVRGGDMSEMIERIATVMRAAYVTDINPHWNGVARAVIEAMREPTEAMAVAGAEWVDDGMALKTSAETVWQAMIDAALK